MSEPAAEPLSPPRPGLWARVQAELRRHWVAYAVVAAFLVIGPVLVHLIFPGVSPLLGVIGGIPFGIYAALCAVPDRFLE